MISKYQIYLLLLSLSITILSTKDVINIYTGGEQSTNSRSGKTVLKCVTGKCPAYCNDRKMLLRMLCVHIPELVKRDFPKLTQIVFYIRVSQSMMELFQYT